jgi:hypothetical protein
VRTISTVARGVGGRARTVLAIGRVGAWKGKDGGRVGAQRVIGGQAQAGSDDRW